MFLPLAGAGAEAFLPHVGLTVMFRLSVFGRFSTQCRVFCTAWMFGEMRADCPLKARGAATAATHVLAVDFCCSDLWRV